MVSGEIRGERGVRNLRLINRRPLMAADDQRQATLVYVSAFLEATLNDRDEYVSMFRDHRAAAAWLPETLYITHYADSSHRIVANFSEDIDLTTTTMPGGRIDGRGLTAWREGTLPTIYGGTTFGAYVAWEREPLATTDPSFTIRLPALHSEWAVDEQTVLVLSLLDGRLPGHNNGVDAEPIDLTVKLTFADGGEAALPLRTFGTLWPTPPVKRLKMGSVESLLAGEPMLPQRFELPLAEFAKRADSPVDTLRTIEFVFDVTPSGALYVDEIAFADDAFAVR